MLVEFKDVVKTYGTGAGMQKAADHVNFSINEGEFAVILGQSGAGKSTVLNMLGGMDVPSEGKVIVAGYEVSAMNDKELSEYRADVIGFVFQFYNLIPSLTAYENIALTKSIVKNAEDADKLLDLVGLSHCRDRFFGCRAARRGQPQKGESATVFGCGKIISRFVAVAVNNKPRQIDLLHMTYAQKSIIGSGGYFPEDVRDVMEIMASGSWKLESVITQEFPLEQISEAIQTAADPDKAFNVTIKF